MNLKTLKVLLLSSTGHLTFNTVCLAHALKISRTNEAIVEEFKEGIEVQADFFVKKREANLIMLRKKSKIVSRSEAVLQSFGSVIPVELSKEAQDNLSRIANQIAHTFELENTSLFFQAIVNGDKVDVIEFAARVGGGLSYRMIKLIVGFDILNATVDSFLDHPVDINYKHPDSYFSTVIIYAQPGVFNSVVGYNELIEQKCIEEFFIFKTKGMVITSEMTSSNRVGAFLIKADSEQELLDKMRSAIDQLEIIDVAGRPIMKKDIFQNVKI